MKRIIPLTPMQEMMFAASLADHSKYVTAAYYHIKNVPFSNLASRFELLINRHEILRTALTVAESKPCMIVTDNPCAELIQTEALPEGPFCIDPLRDDILVKLYVCQNELLLIFSHILLDGFSTTLILRELLAEKAPEGIAHPFRYYLKWLQTKGIIPKNISQNEITSSPSRESNKLALETTYCEQSLLPFQNETTEYERGELSFNLEHSSQIRSAAKSLSVPLGRFIEGVWGLLCSRYADGETWIAAVDSGRFAPIPGITKIAGMFINTIPLKVKLAANTRFCEFIKVFSDKAVLQLQRVGTPITEKIRSLISVELGDFSQNDNFTLVKSNARLVTDFDFVVVLGEEITCRFEYNTCAFSEFAVREIRDHFVRMLSEVTSNPDAVISQIDILTDQEKEYIFRSSADEDLYRAGLIPITETFTQIAKLRPAETAIIADDRSYTYQMVNDQSDAIAKYLMQHQVQEGVLIKLPRSAEFVIAELGVMKAGCYFIPIDTEIPTEKYDEIIKTVSPKFIISRDNYGDITADYASISSNYSIEQVNIQSGNYTEQINIQSGSYTEQINIQSSRHTEQTDIQPSSHIDLHTIKSDNPAYAIMTSGTTGKPKGVLVSHASISHYLAWARMTYHTDIHTVTALIYGFTFDGSFGSIYNSLLSGGTLHILDDETRFNIHEIADFCHKNDVTHLDLPAALIPDFTKLLAAKKDHTHLEYIITGGEQVKRFFPCGVRVSNEYGPTECTVAVTQSFLSAGDFITIGNELPNHKVYVLDSHQKPCPLGIFGECYVSGIQVSIGYIGEGQPPAFSDNPFGDGRMYRTGDRVRFIQIENGYALEFAGRGDGQVKLNGYRIEMGEIEKAAEKYCGSGNAVAALRDTYIALYAVCGDGEELSNRLREVLPHYMMPVVIPVASIPLKESGKPDLEKLSLYHAETTKEVTRGNSPNCQILCDLIDKITGISSKGVDNFTAIGGNSITAMKISFALAERGLSLTPADIITSKNIEEAAEKIGIYREEHKKTLFFIPPNSLKAMIYLSEKFGNKLYTVTTSKSCYASLAEVAARIEKAVKIHDILRCRFSLDTRKNMMANITEIPNVKLLDNTHLLPLHIDPLDEILIFVTLHDNLLTVRYHHIVLDGYSINLLLKELTEGDFPEKPASYAEFVNRFGDNERDLAFYQKTLHGCEPVTLFENKDAPDKMVGMRYFDTYFSEVIKTAAQQIQVTPAVYVMAAVGVFLTIYGNTDRTFIPVVASFRNAGGLLGSAAQTFPVAFSIDGVSEVFSAAASRLQDTLMTTCEHINIPEEYLGLPYVFVDDNTSEELTDSQNYGLVITSGGVILYDENCISSAFLQMLKTRLFCALENALSGKMSIYSKGEYELLTKDFAIGKPIKNTWDYLAFARSDSAMKIAETFRKFGIGAGDLVAVEEDRTNAAIFSYAGISISGAAFLPIDTDLPKLRKEEIIDDCRPAAIIKNGEFKLLNSKHNITSQLCNITEQTHDTVNRLFEANDQKRCTTNNTHDTAYVIYTSGSTGRPKGVPISIGALQSQINWTMEQFAFSKDDIMMHYINFAFDPSVWILYSAFASGAEIEIVPEDIRTYPNKIADFISSQKITIAVLPAAAAYDILLNLGANNLRLIFLGGDKIHIPKRTEFTENIEIVNLYGPTEACINAAFYILPKDCENTACIGKPIGNTDIFILDKEKRPSPIGIPGEIYIGGDKLSDGYINRQSETANAFITIPEFGEVYKTGDIARYNPDGTIEFIGRNDRQVKIRGFRVELSEIEAAIFATTGMPTAVTYHNGILVAFTENRTSDYFLKWNATAGKISTVNTTTENTTTVNATTENTTTVNTTSKNASTENIRSVNTLNVNDLAESEIIERLRTKLPSFMIPNRIILLHKLPLTANGKIDYKSLLIPQQKSDDTPMTDTEKIIAKTYEAVLNLPEGTVGRDSDFFSLGGHSLKLFTLTGALAAHGITPGINDILKYPVVSRLAEVSDQTKGTFREKIVYKDMYDESAYADYISANKTIPINKMRRIENILITGATGFLGAHILRECLLKNEYKEAQIFLPVRGETSRIKSVLDYYFPGESFDFSRLHIFTYDISDSLLRIPEHIDIIYHSAADIRHYAPYEESYRANVTATDYIIQFALDKNAYLAHISTASSVNQGVIAENNYDNGKDFENVYQRTKQEAERHIIASENLRFGIFRVGNITPSLAYRIHGQYSETNAYLKLLKLLIKTKILPDFRGRSGYCFADVTAKAICMIGEREISNRKILHITNPNLLTFGKIFDMLGIISTAKNDNIPDELRGIFAQRTLEKKSDVSSEIKNEATLVLLRRLGFEWIAPDVDYIKAYIDYEQLL
jgi:amino acid adenylation domain-containing protein